MKRVVVVGAGFMGLRTARLVKKKDPTLDVFLIDKKDHFLFTPWIIDALAGDLTYEDIKVDLNKIAMRDEIHFVLGEVHRIDYNTNTLSVKTASGESELAYDALVLSHGAKPSYYGIPGAEKHTHPLKTAGDVRRAHEALHGLFHEAAQIADPNKRKQYLSLGVVGAGPTGIEAAFSVLYFIEKLKKKGSVPEDCDVKMHVIQAAPQILPGFSEKVVDAAADQLRKAGVLVLTGEAVKKINPRSMETSSGKKMPMSFILWAAGIEANRIVCEPETETMLGGYVTVDNYLRVRDNVFCGGDVSAFKRKGAPIPKTAQSAMQMANVIATNVLRCCRESRLKAFNFSNKGALLTAAKTGILTIGYAVTIASPLVIPIRKLFYRWRFYQMTGFWKASKV